MTLDERAKEFVSKIASGTAQEMDYYANLLVKFANETTEYLKIELATSEHDREHNDYELVETYEKISRLEKQIEKMKCCGNCKHRYFIGDELECHLLDNGINCDNEDKWEIKEND